MSKTPITDALSTDPAIEKRDVPARIWRKMAEIEADRAELIEALHYLMSWLRDFGFEWTPEFDKCDTLLARLEGDK